MRIEAYLWMPLLLVGCAAQANRSSPPGPDRPWIARSDVAGNLSVRRDAAVAPTVGFVLPANPGIALPVAPDITPGKQYALADLIDLAQQLNPDTRIAWLQARDAALNSGIARSAYLPRLSASVLTGTQSDHGGSSGLGQPSSPRSTTHGSVAVLSLQWLLFDFGQRAAQLEVAEQGSVVANIQFTQAHQRLIRVVSLAFYHHAAAQARVHTATLSVADARSIQAGAQARLRQGQGTVVEFAQAVQLTAQAELAVVSATGQRDDAYHALLAAVGVSPLVALEIKDADTPALTTIDAAALDEVVREAVQRRPDILAALAAQSAAEAAVRAARADFLPKLFVTASGSRSNGDMDIAAVPALGTQAPTLNLSSHRWSSSVLLGVSVPLYSGGEKNARLALARNHVQASADAFERVKLDAVTNIVGAASRLRTAAETVKAAQAWVDAATLAHDAANAAYQRGVGTLSELASADSQLLQARMAGVDADNAARIASVEFAFACGTLGTAPGGAME